MNFPDDFLVRLRSIRVIFVYFLNLNVPDPYPLLCENSHLVLLTYHVSDLNLQVLHQVTHLLPDPLCDLLYQLLFLLCYLFTSLTLHFIPHLSIAVLVYLNVMCEESE